MIKVSPSVLSANFAELGNAVKEMKNNGADYLHFDVMDGNFVPNISFGFPILADVRKITDMVIDVHLMIDRPIRYVEQFCDAGADIVNIHVEADTEENNLKALELIRGKGKRAGVTVKPNTPAQAILPYLHLCDLILVMTVEPGFGGQSFMDDMMPKVSQIRQYIKEQKPQCELQVDGGVSTVTAPTCVANGADVLVVGSAYFNAQDPKSYVATLHSM